MQDTQEEQVHKRFPKPQGWLAQASPAGIRSSRRMGAILLFHLKHLVHLSPFLNQIH